MKAAVYSPYLDTLGGGEKYMMTIAETLSKNNFDVDILLDQNLNIKGANYLKNELTKRFDLDLIKTQFIKAPIGYGSDFFSRLFFLKRYDLFFYLTDGSIFLPSAKKNFLHIQSPIIGQPSKSWWGKVKLKCWSSIIYNSNFTKECSQKNWPLNSKVIYPPIDIDKIKPLKKKNYILSVGRFFGYLKDKKHEVLIKTFIDLYKSKKVNGWTLHLVGSASLGDEPYLKQLRDLSRGFPVSFYPNLGFNELVKLYGESSIYWHAAGYNETDPTKMEHFGISTVEAMAAGCIPVVIGKGGQVEIVGDKISGYLWNSLKELKNLTVNLTSDSQLRKEISNNAIKRSMSFSKEKFTYNLIDLISQLN